MFTAKPVLKGTVAALDGSDKSTDVQDLSANGVELLQAQDFGLYGNPDGAMGSVAAYPGLKAPATSARSETMSGKGLVAPAAKTTAPMSNPFPRAKNAIKTSPSTIAK